MGTFIAGLSPIANEKVKDDNQNDIPVHIDGDRSNDIMAQPGNLKSSKEPEAADTTMDTACNNDVDKAYIFADIPPAVKNIMNKIPVIDINNNVTFDLGFVDVPDNEPVLMDNDNPAVASLKISGVMNPR